MASSQQQPPTSSHMNVSNALPANGVISTGGAFAKASTATISQVNIPLRTSVAHGTVQVYEDEEGIDCSPCCSNETFRRTFRNIVYGQILSLCLCGTGVSSQLLSNQGVNVPTGNFAVAL
ncbi:unnamed protein product [Gongylonema pulchrum]|uniref:LITAF domain-containing protein n=1 Tax=Gongylonema pulchrum TaxID=637853 RepID=A0A183F0K2_9BILA|nr:unnamed protein product [Gongylonema pulchrum]